MNFFHLLLCLGFATAAVTKREAEAEAVADADAEADADADPALYGHHGVLAHAAPVCTLTPVKECKPRTVEHPRKVCKTLVDVHEDTTVTETCEEVVTTECSQTSQTAHKTAAVVEQSTKLVETQEGGPHSVVSYGAHHGYGKRQAEEEAAVEAEEADREAKSILVGVATPIAVAHPVHVAVSHPVKSVDAPVCTSTPVKTCNKTPVSRPRKTARVVCDTIVDVTTIEDCVETVTKQCTSSVSHQTAHTAVVGTDSKVVATNEPHGVIGHALGVKAFVHHG